MFSISRLLLYLNHSVVKVTSKVNLWHEKIEGGKTEIAQLTAKHVIYGYVSYTVYTFNYYVMDTAILMPRGGPLS